MFDLTEQDHERISAWRKEQDEIVKRSQASIVPNYGAIGGELTYSFTPTSLGTVVKVKHGLTYNELDLTDYDSW